MNKIYTHKPGDPMPCSPDAKVFVQTRSGKWSKTPFAARSYYWGVRIAPACRIVAWRYAEHDSQAKIESSTPSKYHKRIRTETVDVYDVLVAFDVTNPASQHAIKKLLMPGKRGAKGTLQDLREASASIARAIEIEMEAGND